MSERIRMIKFTLPTPWRMPSPLKVAVRELETAQRALLEAQTGREYAEAMCQYNTSRVRRLRAYIARESAGASDTPPLPILDSEGGID